MRESKTFMLTSVIIQYILSVISVFFIVGIVVIDWWVYKIWDNDDD